jgi:hypothetical protein
MAAPKYRTLAANGDTAPFMTRKGAEKAAQRVANATGKWCGVEAKDAAGEWWLVATAEPTGTRPPEEPGLINSADRQAGPTYH